MKTLFAACLARLGLSQPAAAELLDARLDTIKAWSVGRNPVPAGVWDELRKLEARIIDASEAIREAWEDSGESNQISARASDHAGKMALADFVLSIDGGPKFNVTLIEE